MKAAKLLTTAEAAARKGVPLRTLQEWIQRGWLKANRVPPGVSPMRQTCYVEAVAVDAFTPPKRGRVKGTK
jgi:excisionase family DNA binding protein